MFNLDHYTLKARLYPSFLVLVPPFVMAMYYITDFEKYIHYLSAFFVVGLFTFLLSQLGRDKGKQKEPELFKYFGGRPTTQILRHNNDFLNKITKQQYYNRLSSKITGIQMPTREQEINSPSDADQVYASCASYLISKTRDTNTFKLLFKENISYGFRRNLWGMKLWAIYILILCIGLHTYFAGGFKAVRLIQVNDLYLYVFFLLSLIFWIFIVTKDWVKIPAFGYAERLYETLNNL